MRTVSWLAPCLVFASCSPEPPGPSWRSAFGYAEASLLATRIGDLGMPFVPVGFGADTVWLPFDTGNMVGLTLDSATFAGLGLPCTGTWQRLDSGGLPLPSGCIAGSVALDALGHHFDSLEVFQFFHERLPGLVGPDMLPGTRFTLDYRQGLLAVDGESSPDSVPGFEALPLVRSPRHPRLILVRGRVQGRDVLFEIDTGKSRATIDRALVDALGLDVTPAGVGVDRVELGSRSWTVPSARVVDNSGSSQGLPERIGFGVGSDVLAGFVFTVDYAAQRLWIERSPLVP